MIEAAHAVLLQGKRVGTILQRGDVARFIFDDGYWEDPDRNVLGLWFEDNPRQSPQATLRLPTWFSNLLPEGQLREWIARDQHVSSDRELQLLLRIGHDLPGAVEVLQDEDFSRFSVDLLSEASPISDRGEQASPWKFSLAGVGLKFSMLRQGDRLTIPAANEIGDWIVKFPDAYFRQVPQNEYATMRLAKRLGIDVPDIKLVHRDNLPPLPDVVWPTTEDWAFAVSRFDRSADGRRIHIEDFAQVRGFYSANKYSGSFETIAALAYRSKDRRSLREFVRRTVFNLFMGNGDAHLKNWSMIYTDGRIPAISPAYDLVSTAPYSSESEPENFGLKFGGTKSFSRIRRSAFVRMQSALGAASEDVLDVVDDTIEKFSGEWNESNKDVFPKFVSTWVDGHFHTIREQLRA